jgi:hypothetical protein
MTTIDTSASKAKPSAAGSLASLVKAHPGKLAFTFSLIGLENVLLLIYPLFGGFAINAIVEGNLMLGLSYAVVVLMFWLIGAARRAVDTQVFTRIYADLAVAVAMTQRSQGESVSTAAARVVLAREFVDFFEKHVPILATSIVSVFGAVGMLLLIEPWVGVATGAALLLAVFWVPGFAARNETLHTRVNNRLEREIDLVAKVGQSSLQRHYLLLSRLRIRLSNREAMAYLAIGLVAAGLFGLTIALLAGAPNVQAGHIYAVMTYLWTFVTSLDEAPALVDQIARLKEIGRRVGVETPAGEPEGTASPPSP